MRWVAPENYHVTLRFLGATPVARIPGLVAAVRRESAAQPAFRARLGALLLQPSPRRTRVVALQVDSAGQLEGLAARVERGVRAAGAAPEPRPFRPHLTLGRARGGRRLRAGATAALETEPAGTSFWVDAALLYESELSSGGARYHALERIALGAPTHPH